MSSVRLRPDSRKNAEPNQAYSEYVYEKFPFDPLLLRPVPRHRAHYIVGHNLLRYWYRSSGSDHTYKSYESH
jgi:hypothetical protein